MKRAPLSDYRIVYFATHGLVAGDVKGVGEPSLALSMPRQPSEFDDGLLSASEVAQLKLNGGLGGLVRQQHDCRRHPALKRCRDWRDHSSMPAPFALIGEGAAR